MKGFTLLETLVTVLIFTFIVAGMYGVLNITRTNYDTNLVSLNLQRQARQGMSRLIREIRQAYWAKIKIVPRVPYNPDDPDANNNASITFDTPDANDVHYSVVKTAVSDKVLWQLKRNCPTCTEITIANDIRYLDFSQISGQILNIQMQASKTFRSLGKDRTLTFPLTDPLTEQVTVRNP